MDNKTRFIFDPSTLVHEIDSSSSILLKTLSGKLRLSGEGIVLAVRRIIVCFKDAAFQEDVIEELETKYEKTALSKLITLLISKNVLISETVYNGIYSFDNNFLEKYRRLGVGEKGLKQITSEMNAMTIGLICTSQFAECFLSIIKKDQLVGRIKCVITDKTDSNSDCGDNRIEVSYLGSDAELQLRELIEASDFVVANSNYESFAMFSHINRTCLENNKKWLRVVIQDEYTEIGPLFVPGETCCYACMDKRMADNLQDGTNVEYVALQKDKMDLYVKEIGTYSSYPFTQIVSAVTFYEIMRYFSGLSCALEGSVLTFFEEGYKMNLHKVFKVSQCNSCKDWEK